MTARRDKGDQLLGSLEEMMGSIANLPDGEFDGTAPTQRPHAITQKYWPELWQEIPNQRTDAETRGREVIRRMRNYLRLFWGAKNPHDRDWHIYRAREYYQRLRILPGLLDLSLGESVAGPVAESKLDEPPQRNLIEDALYQLQRRSEKPSLAPRICRGDDCKQPYFLSSKKGQKFCSPDCARPSLLASKRKYDHKKRSTK